MDKAIAESKSALAQHEYDLNRAKSQYAYNFAYKAYEETFEQVNHEFRDILEQVKLLEAKLYLLKGIAKMSAARLFKKIKKDVNEHLAVPKIPFKEVV